MQKISIKYLLPLKIISSSLPRLQPVLKNLRELFRILLSQRHKILIVIRALNANINFLNLFFMRQIEQRCRIYLKAFLIENYVQWMFKLSFINIPLVVTKSFLNCPFMSLILITKFLFSIYSINSLQHGKVFSPSKTSTGRTIKVTFAMHRRYKKGNISK